MNWLFLTTFRIGYHSGFGGVRAMNVLGDTIWWPRRTLFRLRERLHYAIHPEQA